MTKAWTNKEVLEFIQLNCPDDMDLDYDEDHMKVADAVEEVLVANNAGESREVLAQMIQELGLISV